MILSWYCMLDSGEFLGHIVLFYSIETVWFLLKYSAQLLSFGIFGWTMDCKVTQISDCRIIAWLERISEISLLHCCYFGFLEKGNTSIDVFFYWPLTAFSINLLFTWNDKSKRGNVVSFNKSIDLLFVWKHLGW